MDRLEGQQAAVHVVNDRELFAYASLWETWDKEGEVVESCTIITGDFNAVAKPIHHHIHVILTPNDYDNWLHGDDGELLFPYPPNEMIAYKVSRVVNNARNDTLECIEPL